MSKVIDTKYYRDTELVQFEYGLRSGFVVHNQIRALNWIRFCSAEISWPNLIRFSPKMEKV